MEFTIDDMIKAFKAGARHKEKLSDDELKQLLCSLDPLFERKTYRRIAVENGLITNAQVANLVDMLDRQYERATPREPFFSLPKT